MKKILFLLISIVCLTLTSCSENYSQGERIGTVVQFSQTGLIWDSWEGQLNLTQTGMNTSGAPFNFSFDNDRSDQTELIALLNQAQAEGWKVKLKYHEVTGWNWFNNRGCTNHFITDVEVIDKDFAHPLQNGVSKDSTYQVGTKENPFYVKIVQ